MANDWLEYKETTAESITEFVSIALKVPYLYRGHGDVDWELEPAIDRQDFSGRNISRAAHERLVFDEFKRLAIPILGNARQMIGSFWL